MLVYNMLLTFVKYIPTAVSEEESTYTGIKAEV